MPQKELPFVVALAVPFLVLPLTTPLAHSQVLFGSLVGNVTDPSHAGVPQASVRITQVETNEFREAQTNATGLYSFPAIPSGTYTVEFRKSGFQTATQNEIVVRNNSVVRVDCALLLGAVSESVQVTAAALQTDGADVRVELGSKTLQDTPLPPGRNFQNLLITVPGITPPINSNSVSANPARSLTYMANGAERSGNVMTIDGASVESTWLQQVSAYVPGLEAIEVVNVVSNSYDAAQASPAAPLSTSRSRPVPTRSMVPRSSTTSTTA